MARLKGRAARERTAAEKAAKQLKKQKQQEQSVWLSEEERNFKVFNRLSAELRQTYPDFFVDVQAISLTEFKNRFVPEHWEVEGKSPIEAFTYGYHGINEYVLDTAFNALQEQEDIDDKWKNRDYFNQNVKKGLALLKDFNVTREEYDLIFSPSEVSAF